MNIGLLALHVGLGAMIAAHGAQKLFGVLGGNGLAATGGFFESLGLRPGRVNALLAGGSEFFGGLLLALGLLTPLGAAAVIGVMVVAYLTVHRAKGFFNGSGGYEFNLLIALAAFALAAVGPGEWSLDHALSLDLAGTGWGLAALGAGVLGALGALASGRLAGSRGHSGAQPTAA